MSLKTGWWKSKIQAFRALKLSLHYTTELAARLVGKHKASLRCNNQHKHRAEQHWHAKLMGSLLQKDRGGSHEEDGLSNFSSPHAWAPQVAEDTRACTSPVRDDTNVLLSSCTPEDTTVFSKGSSGVTENMRACTSLAQEDTVYQQRVIVVLNQHQLILFRTKNIDCWVCIKKPVPSKRLCWTDNSK